eukprot:CAMPEP_0170584128 /NCGR_PEP_ID=MMETSP0224-20130122/8522_1 /TAXON_ID=285029 /ORGANISM="Togula jolla, Strain CCCM 725" /LENGTH=484 /DNA_ID=CAMNT_0010907539 /DNA_START=54 /DNA_END=1508 /DNA_ORIENTATION=+
MLAAMGCGTLAGCAIVSFSTVLRWGPESQTSQVAHSSSPSTFQGPDLRQKASRDFKDIKWVEVVSHNTPDDAWLVVDDVVLDVTAFAPHHPGGSIILKFAGTDASDQFAAFHRPRVRARLNQFAIGKLDKEISDAEAMDKASSATLEYRALRERLWKEGYFEPSMRYFVVKACIGFGLAVLAVALVLVPLPPGSWCRCIAFLIHDAAHNGILAPSVGGGFNKLAWFLGSPFFGASLSMWITEHSLHHAITLRPREDPQFDYLPVWLTSEKELLVPWTDINILHRIMVPIQHITFVPILIVLGRLNFYAISISFLVRNLLSGGCKRHQVFGMVMDIVGIVFFFSGLMMLTLQLPDRREQVLFLLSSHFTIGFLHLQLLLSHLATDTYTVEEERSLQFFAFQVQTTRNLEVAEWSHWFHGGLEYQIEHHLFPQLPRHYLQEVQPLIRDICHRHGVQYRSVGFGDALAEVLSDLRSLAGAIAPPTMG